MHWKDRRVLVTGGASFIGSHLVERLVKEGAKVRVADNLMSGKKENLKSVEANVEFLEGNLLETEFLRSALKDMDTVFHLASDHGGRGYVDLHQVDTASNFALDGLCFLEASRAGVRKVVFASSGCVYPNHLQGNPWKELFLTEDLVKPPYDADNMYGWAKLMGELALRFYCKERRLKGVSCRLFTVYGPRGKENHAVMGMIAKAFIGQDPYEVWGDGTQIRNWTYVSDTVDGLVKAGEKIDDGSSVNIGTMERISVAMAARLILDAVGHKAEVKFLKDMPTGPKNRVASCALAKKVLGWEPKVKFKQGVLKAVHWYVATHKPKEVETDIKRILIERK